MTLNELELTFANLRHSWQGDWPGLPKVVQACVDQLGLRAGRMNARFKAIDLCLRTLSHLMEQQGSQLATNRQEPPYHNRLHTADTLVALTTLLLRSRTLDASRSKPPFEWEWLGLLAMLGHDFRHPGQINRFPQQIESATVSHLRPVMTQCGVNASDQQYVAELILFTDPLQAPALHRKWRSSSFDLRQLECLAILLEEADILASCLPNSGPALGESLKQEWQKAEFAAASTVATPAGRQVFLRNALFSSPASLDLAIPQKVAQQTLNLAAQLKNSVSNQTK
jgi:hypothetical protein